MEICNYDVINNRTTDNNLPSCRTCIDHELILNLLKEQNPVSCVIIMTKLCDHLIGWGVGKALSQIIIIVVLTLFCARVSSLRLVICDDNSAELLWEVDHPQVDFYFKHYKWYLWWVVHGGHQKVQRPYPNEVGAPRCGRVQQWETAIDNRG